MSDNEPMADSPVLSLEQAAELCKAWVPIGGLVHEYARRLQQAGFSAFLPACQFAESFCTSAEELEVHRRYVAERGKEILGTPMPNRASPDQAKLLYRSEFNQALRAQNDARNGGLPLAELTERYPNEPWRQHVDPAERARLRAWMLDMSAHDARWAQANAAKQDALDTEVERHGSGLSSQFTFSVRDRLRFYLEVMKRDAAKLGFSYDAAKSETTFPVFSRSVNAAWDLCLTLQKPTGIGRNPREGEVWPQLELRQRTLEGESEQAAVGQLLIIKYNIVIPGFSNAYRVFKTLGELELFVRAHLCLLGFSIETIAQTAAAQLPTA